MWLRYSYRIRPMMAILAATVLMVALACGGEEATPTSEPTATTSAPPTATSPAMVEPTAISPAMVEATTAPGQPTATSPAMVEATATPVPDVMIDEADWANFLMNHRGYKPEWGEPQYGGTIKMSGPRPVSNWLGGYMGWGAFASSFGGFQSFNSLLMMDPWGVIRDSPICDLCESFEVSADGLTYTFQLRQGVMFHSEGWGKENGAPAESYGTELTCEDVKASMEWLTSPPPHERAPFVNRYKTYWAHFDQATCPDGPDGHTVVLKFAYYRNATLGWLAAGMQVWNKEYREWMDIEHPGIQSSAVAEGYLMNHGTGPFMPVTGDSQTVIKAERNPNYFREGAPFADGWQNYFIQDYNTKFAALVTGKTHHAGHGSSGVTKAQVQQIQTSYEDIIELHIVRYNHIQVFMMNPLRPPFDDWKVRWAVNLFLDRQDWDGFMTVGNVKMATIAYYFHPDVGWSIPPEEYLTFPGFNPATKDADIAEANRLLDEVFGEGNRPKSDQYIIQLLSRREPSLWGIDQFKKHLGWEFNVKYVDTYGAISTDCLYTIRTEASTVMENTLTADPGDALNGLHSTRTGKPSCYILGYKGKGAAPDEEIARVDAMLGEADSTLDPVRRAELLREIELYMVNERLTSATLGSMNVAWPVRRELKGVRFYNLGTPSQQRLTDRMWLVE